ncbi:phytoene desaturase family protein [Agromyces seonyuensis]|uniref:FAD-dependent oxidoreductase n=1 Tax=Agromyces seonyuensis TaxID=2662446 RepID=A0A6I4P5A6_9MICO|nr:NAD(P)/FAD-dependent oxidoreductase [Agromyces seonyuensis]MWB98594.1 FAD-dependent oxidoreductase [Agromyces seonyuensis]
MSRPAPDAHPTPISPGVGADSETGPATDPTEAVPEYDAVIVGGGHNGLTAAAYLARAGKRVLLLERADHLGGAAVSAEAFPDAYPGVRISRYSYLVSLLPRRILDDLGLELDLVRRRYSSYTPDPADPTRGLLVDVEADPAAAAGAFDAVGAGEDAAAWASWYAGTTRAAQALFPTLTEPLPTRAEARALVSDDDVWNALVEQPIGTGIRRAFGDGLVQGVVATDALIGTFAGIDDDEDAARDANRCYLYHVIGGGTGDWDVPVGGMGAVSGALERAARAAGATLVTGAAVVSVSPDGEVVYASSSAADAAGRSPRTGALRRVRGARVLANVAPAVLDRLLAAGGADPAVDGPAPEGAQVKVNLLLTRLPKLADPTVDPAAAFAGTFHINETAAQLSAAHEAAAAGRIPSPLPAEIYCHTLSDPSILTPELREAGFQTLTVFGLHVPHRLVAGLTDAEHDAKRAELQQAVLDSLDSVLGEPILGVVARDADGNPCIETKTTRDLEDALGMPGGNIFHGPLSWPWLEPDDAGASPEATPAERWGVATRHPRILLAGSGAVRGGAVSGLGGHNAAMALLEAEG